MLLNILIKQYLVNSTLTISVWTIFSSIATLFGKDAFIISADLKIIDNIKRLVELKKVFTTLLKDYYITNRRYKDALFL